MSAMDGSESVDQFLARIAATPSTNGGNTKHVDDDFIKARQERQARRLERARSISPSKTGPLRATPAFSTQEQPSQITQASVLRPPIELTPNQSSVSGRDSERATPTKASSTLKDRPSTPTATSLARSGTLSWQQRPTSRDGGRQRPFSMVSPPKPVTAVSSSQENSPVKSRTDIAASLSQKDPTWFKQTQDRGQGSLAYRRSQVEDTPEPPSARSRQLPGMSQSFSREPSKSPAPGSEEKENRPENNRFSRGTTPDIVAMRNSMMMEKPTHLRPASSDLGPNTQSMLQEPDETSAGQNVMSPPHSASPTKGMGGFVESAMMRRSDSVSKRWSVRAAPGLKRGDSVLGARPRSLHLRGMSHDLSLPRAGSPSSPLHSSRPTSSQGQDALQADAKSPATLEKSVTSPAERVARPQTPPDDTNLARSGSRASSPRKWSPTKSTWLESALQQKQEPPKMQAFQEEQPKWKLDLQRSKSLRSRDPSPDKRTSVALAQQEPSKDAVPTPQSSSKATDVTPPVFPGWSSQPKKEASAMSTPRTSARSDVQQKFPTPVKPAQAETPLIEQSVLESTPKKHQPLNESIPETMSASSVAKTTSAQPVKSPPALRPKPQEAAKPEPLPALKPRTQELPKSQQEEPEFKSMFGKLKRTTTQNYVAPDLLKDNIMTGKAALNVTGGPVKTKRVDEFKESILARKQQMKEAPTSTQERPDVKPKPEAIIPEALARRKTLSKASAPTHLANPRSDTKPQTLSPKPAATAEVKQLTSSAISAKPSTSVHNANTATPAQSIPDVAKNTTAVGTVPKELPARSSTLIENKSRPAVTGSPKPGVDQAKTWPSSAGAQTSVPMTKTTSPLPSPPASGSIGTLAGNKLASRINPNLAAMLSRGGSPKLPENGNSSVENTSSLGLTRTTSAKDEKAADLTHMTKGRAKGPKRRAPKVDSSVTSPSTLQKSASTDSSKSTPKPSANPISKSGTMQVKADGKSETTVNAAAKHVDMTKSQIVSGIATKPVMSSISPRSLPQAPVDKKEDADSDHSDRPKFDTPKSKPAIAAKSADVRRVSAQKATPPLSPKPSIKGTSAEANTDIRKPTHAAIGAPKDVDGQVVVQKRSANDRPSEAKITNFEVDATTVKPVTPHEPSWSARPSNKVSPSAVSPSPDTATSNRKPFPPSKPANQGLGLKWTPSPKQSNNYQPPRTLTPPPEPVATSGSDDKHIEQTVRNFVGTIPKDSERTEFDVQQFLIANKPVVPKIDTTYRAIAEIRSDGRKTSMPAQQEHILYEDSMYLVAHTFTTNGGASTSEVHLWCGNRVAEASIEDAQVFCRKDARDHNTKLELMKQGKETTPFLQAMGGILIVRRSKTSQSYMLCGRRILGHIVFDEVECTANALCPGFSYLIASAGKLFLWKGKGASADEVGSARLIGMDLAANGFEEIEQGSESVSFWNAVGSKSSTKWHSDWEKRGEMNGFPTALYRVEHEKPGMLTNLASWGLKRAASPAKQATKALCQPIPSPTQADLDHTAIHILDGYKALYVILTRQCTGKAAEFVTALYLAQEIAMLSPGIQDRPMVPLCYVVAGDMNDDVKACFRNWSAVEAASMAGKDSLCARLEDVMEALEL